MTTPTKTAVTIPTLRSGNVDIEAFRVGQHWAIAQKYAKDGWALTHLTSGAVDARGHWDEATASALAACIAVPEGVDEPELPPLTPMPDRGILRPWADEVLAKGNAIALATAGVRLAPKMDGLILFRVTVERTAEATLYVLAESAEKAEAMSHDVDVSWGEEDYSERAWKIEASEVPSDALSEDVVAPKGFPATSVREAILALAAKAGAS